MGRREKRQITVVVEIDKKRRCEYSREVFFLTSTTAAVNEIRK